MDKENNTENSRLIPILREGVAIIQMIFFKELKTVITKNHPDLEASAQTMLTGAITNELFGSHNPEEKFQQFRNQHQGSIEQELLNLRNELPQMTAPLADALRIQTLCDNQEGVDSTYLLKQADSFGILPQDRDIPMPSAFMETVRTLGGDHKLIIPPAEIDKTEDQKFLQ